MGRHSPPQKRRWIGFLLAIAILCGFLWLGLPAQRSLVMATLDRLLGIMDPQLPPGPDPQAGSPIPLEPVIPEPIDLGVPKIAYLTFDDGPSVNTPLILDILQDYGIKATFFVIGNPANSGKAMYRRIVAEGHSLGNHTYSHQYHSIYSSEDAFMADLIRLENLLVQSTGVRPTIIRFPGGSNNQVSHAYSGPGFMQGLTQRVMADGYVYFDWSVTSSDAAVATATAKNIVDSVLRGVGTRKQVMILLHDAKAKTTTVEALPTIIENLTAEGFIFRPITSDLKGFRFL